MRGGRGKRVRDGGREGKEEKVGCIAYQQEWKPQHFLQSKGTIVCS